MRSPEVAELAKSNRGSDMPITAVAWLVVVASIILVGRSLKVCVFASRVSPSTAGPWSPAADWHVFSVTPPMWLIYLQLANNARLCDGSLNFNLSTPVFQCSRSADLIARVWCEICKSFCPVDDHRLSDPHAPHSLIHSVLTSTAGSSHAVRRQSFRECYASYHTNSL